MAKRESETQGAVPLEGLRTLTRLKPLLERLRPLGAERDVAGNRRLHMDDAVGLVLLSFFNPALRSLRDLCSASKLTQVRKKLGCGPTSLGSLSESLRLFPADELASVVDELAGRLPEAPGVDSRLKALGLSVGAFDGSVLKALLQVSQTASGNKRTREGVKLHLQFEVLQRRPSKLRVTDASGRGEAGEKQVLREQLEPHRCYVVDRGYEEFALFNDIARVQSAYVCRVRGDHHFTAGETRELPEAARQAGVLEDSVGRMGSEKSRRIEHPDHAQRRIVVKFTEHPSRGAAGKPRTGVSHEIVLVTNLLDVPAELIAALYRSRWLIELFFRWLKCVLGCRHLISENHNGIELQMYCALIAFLLIQLTLGGRAQPSAWTFKLLCLYQQGWATEEEVLAHVSELERKARKQGASAAN